MAERRQIPNILITTQADEPLQLPKVQKRQRVESNQQDSWRMRKRVDSGDGLAQGVALAVNTQDSDVEMKSPDSESDVEMASPSSNLGERGENNKESELSKEEKRRQVRRQVRARHLYLTAQMREDEMKELRNQQEEDDEYRKVLQSWMKNDDNWEGQV